MNKKILWLSAIALSISVNQAVIACGCNNKGHSKNVVSKQDLTANQKEKINGVKNNANDEFKSKS